MDRFRTIVDIPASPSQISYRSRCLFMGSCFSDEIGRRMAEHKFPVLINPFGSLFNPSSVAANLMKLIDGNIYTTADLVFHNGLWFSMDHYTGFARTDPQECLDAINASSTLAQAWLKGSDYLIITFGTAWVYRYRTTGKVAANCHKLPATDFDRLLLSSDNIAGEYETLFKALLNFNPRIQVIFTVSPVRHLKDGAVNNQVSKSVLLLSIHELRKKYEFIHYFPAYEVFMDELRDYRFYASDMLHPGEQGSEYVWERFCNTYFPDETRRIMARVATILKALAHRPIKTRSPDRKKFVENTLEQIRRLTTDCSEIDFSGEITLLRNQL